MASNSIVLKDTTYNGVSSIEVPVSGGGTALFTDVSDTTAAAADVAQGKYFYTAAGSRTQGSLSSVTVDALNVTENGTYIAQSGHAYSPVTVSVSGGGGDDLKKVINRSVTTLTLPSDLTTIGDYAFHSCTNLVIPSLPSGLTTIGNYSFSGCRNLALTSIPSGVTKIGDGAFYDCRKLAITSIPNTVTSIGIGAFAGCAAISSITCEGTITSLGNFAFGKISTSDKTYFVSVMLPNLAVSTLLTVFGSSSSSLGNSYLKTVDIGNTSAIAANAFAYCTNLQTLVIRKTGSICTLANVSAFTNTPMRGYKSLTGTVYVPSALISSYQTASNWSTLYNGGTLTFAAIEGSPYEL